MISERIARPRFSPPFASGARLPLDAVGAAAAKLLLSLTGLIGLGLFWTAVSGFVAEDLPGPIATWAVFRDLMTDPFYNAGPNDKGIGLQLFASLQRVAIGFSAGTLIAIPVGVLIGVHCNYLRGYECATTICMTGRRQ